MTNMLISDTNVLLISKLIWRPKNMPLGVPLELRCSPLLSLSLTIISKGIPPPLVMGQAPELLAASSVLWRASTQKQGVGLQPKNSFLTQTFRMAMLPPYQPFSASACPLYILNCTLYYVLYTLYCTPCNVHTLLYTESLQSVYCVQSVKIEECV